MFQSLFELAMARDTLGVFIHLTSYGLRCYTSSTTEDGIQLVYK